MGRIYATHIYIYIHVTYIYVSRYSYPSFELTSFHWHSSTYVFLQARRIVSYSSRRISLLIVLPAVTCVRWWGLYKSSPCPEVLKAAGHVWRQRSPNTHPVLTQYSASTHHWARSVETNEQIAKQQRMMKQQGKIKTTKKAQKRQSGHQQTRPQMNTDVRTRRHWANRPHLSQPVTPQKEYRTGKGANRKNKYEKKRKCRTRLVLSCHVSARLQTRPLPHSATD